MAIGFVELQGGIQRTQDIGTIKHNEDVKGNIDQNNFQIQAEKQGEQKANSVNNSEESNQSKNDADTGSGSRNTYAGDGGRNRKKKETPKDGIVIVKGVKHFDMSV